MELKAHRGARRPLATKLWWKLRPCVFHSEFSGISDVSFGTRLSQLPAAPQSGGNAAGESSSECKNVCASGALVLLPGSPTIQWLSPKYKCI